jgi:hypothetical protein
LATVMRRPALPRKPTLPEAPDAAMAALVKLEVTVAPPATGVCATVSVLPASETTQS